MIILLLLINIHLTIKCCKKKFFQQKSKFTKDLALEFEDQKQIDIKNFKKIKKKIETTKIKSLIQNEKKMPLNTQESWEFLSEEIQWQDLNLVTNSNNLCFFYSTIRLLIINLDFRINLKNILKNQNKLSDNFSRNKFILLSLIIKINLKTSNFKKDVIVKIIKIFLKLFSNNYKENKPDSFQEVFNMMNMFPNKIILKLAQNFQITQYVTFEISQNISKDQILNKILLYEMDEFSWQENSENNFLKINDFVPFLFAYKITYNESNSKPSQLHQQLYLYNYIYKNNETRPKIELQVPIINQESSKINFILNIELLPEENSKVVYEKYPEKKSFLYIKEEENKLVFYSVQTKIKTILYLSTGNIKNKALTAGAHYWTELYDEKKEINVQQAVLLNYEGEQFQGKKITEITFPDLQNVNQELFEKIESQKIKNIMDFFK